MRLPAIALDRHGFVTDVNAAADIVFDHNIKIKDKRLFVRDPDSRTLLKEAIDQLKNLPRLNSLALEPVIVPRMDKLPVIVRIWPFEGPVHPPGQEVRALLTLNALGPRPGPPAAILAKTFRLTPSEAKLACIIARGAPPDIAARELKISRETARNQCPFWQRRLSKRAGRAASASRVRVNPCLSPAFFLRVDSRMGDSITASMMFEIYCFRPANRVSPPAYRAPALE
jgi:DNA-binding CsgD family transcriptional regulator